MLCVKKCTEIVFDIFEIVLGVILTYILAILLMIIGIESEVVELLLIIDDCNVKTFVLGKTKAKKG